MAKKTVPKAQKAGIWNNGNSRAKQPGMNVKLVAGVVIALLLVLLAFAMLGNSNGKDTGSAPAANQPAKAPEPFVPKNDCERAGGEIALWQDCSASNIIGGNFDLKDNQVCCTRGSH